MVVPNQISTDIDTILSAFYLQSASVNTVKVGSTDMIYSQKFLRARIFIFHRATFIASSQELQASQLKEQGGY
jgi:hypothetical protein